MPIRIQRLRTKGWRMPDNTVYVGRPTQYGNPFRIENNQTREEVTNLYRTWAIRQIKMGKLDLSRLCGKDLACWCSLSDYCHADVLLELATKEDWHFRCWYS